MSAPVKKVTKKKAAAIPVHDPAETGEMAPENVDFDAEIDLDIKKKPSTKAKAKKATPEFKEAETFDCSKANDDDDMAAEFEAAAAHIGKKPKAPAKPALVEIGTIALKGVKVNSKGEATKNIVDLGTITLKGLKLSGPNSKSASAKSAKKGEESALGSIDLKDVEFTLSKASSLSS